MRDRDLYLQRMLDDLERDGRRRFLRAMDPLPAGRVRLNGREVVNFSSNDYMGLSRHPVLVERAQEWASRYGAGLAASRLVSGHFKALEMLEHKIALAKGAQAAVIFASGWQCNTSVLAALLEPTLWSAEPLVFTDRLNHASLHMGCKAAGIKQIRFRHNDLEHLDTLLAHNAQKHGPRFIITESIFSMDGDGPDLVRLEDIATEWDAFLYVDEAHATGVYGPYGFGLASGSEADLVMGTFSKGMGSFGAYVAGSQTLKDFLVNRASGLIYATALPPAVLGAIDAAIDLVPTLGNERTHLYCMAEKVRAAFHAAGLDTGKSSSQIIPVILGDEQRTKAVAQSLEEQGFLGVAIRPPTVPAGSSRIRFVITAAHTEEDVDRLIAAVIATVQAHPL